MNGQAPFFDANVDHYSTSQMLMQQLSLQENAAIRQGRNSVLDSRTEFEKQGETERQSHERDMEIGYDDKLQSLAFEALEKTFQDEIRKLMEEQIHAENEENFRHREKLMEIINKYKEKLSALQAQQASRREEFLRKYEQSSTIRTSSTKLHGNTWPTSTKESIAKDPSAGFSSSTSSNAATSSNAFSSNSQSPKSSIFGSPSTGFSFGASSASSATANASPFSFGASSTSSGTTNASPFSFDALLTLPSTRFSFGASSAPTNASQSTGFSFGASTNASQPAGFSCGSSSTSSGPTNATPPMVFNSSSSSPFSFTEASASVFSSPSPPRTPRVFGSTGFAASAGNNDQMNAEDSIAKDPVQSSAPSMPVFGQPSVAPSPPGFTFGSTVPSPGPGPFMFSGQQNQAAPQNPSLFRASGSLCGSFALGSGGGENSSGRKKGKINRSENRKELYKRWRHRNREKFVKINRNKNRKK